MSDVKQQESTDKCNDSFIECPAANRIKFILNEYAKIFIDKKCKTNQQIQIEANQLIHIVPFHQNYSIIHLFNDFYHIKYQHNTNEDGNQFNIFYKFIFDQDNVLKCDINTCYIASKYYNRRRNIPSINLSDDDHDNFKDVHLMNILSRIHIYFIHSHDISQLSHDEIEYIEKQLNEYQSDEMDEDVLNDKKLELISTVLNNNKRNSLNLFGSSCYNKFVTKENHHLNTKQISQILSNNNILIEEDELIKAFGNYDRENLLNDLCQILINKTEENVLLTDILKNKLNFHDQNRRQIIYGILCHEYIMLNTNDFIVILQCIASKEIEGADCNEIAKIARTAKLTANLFITL